MSGKTEYNRFISAFMKEHVPAGSAPGAYRQALSDGAAAWRERNGAPVRSNPGGSGDLKSLLVLGGVLAVGYAVMQAQARTTTPIAKP